MGRDQRNRRRGVVMRASQQPDPDYWKKRAMHFERALLAAVASCPGRELEVLNQDLAGMTLDAEELLSENGERRGVRFKVQDTNTKKVHVDEVRQPGGGTVHFIPAKEAVNPPTYETVDEEAAQAFEEQISAGGFKVVDKRRAVGPTTIPVKEEEK